MPELKKRFPARKVRISDLINGKFLAEQKCVMTPYAMKVSRASLIGVVVGKFVSDDNSFASITMDDSTETIRAKSFGSTKLFENVDVGSDVEVIGRVREYNDEIYLMPEIVKKISPEIEMLRRLETTKNAMEWKNKISLIENNKDKKLQELEKLGINKEELDSVLEFLNVPKESKVDVNESVIINMLSEMDKGDGVGYKSLFDNSSLPEYVVEKIVGKLLEDGVCFEPKPGVLKICS